MTLADPFAGPSSTRRLLGRALAPAVLLGGLVTASPTAHAQSAEAEVLFRDGRKLITAGKLEVGCDKLAASDRLEGSVGTLLNLGDCREKLGRHASAWAAFKKAESLAKRTGGDDKRRAEAAKRATRLEPKLSNLVINVPTKVEGMVVKRDDEVVDAASFSTAVPLDPDTYAIVVEAPGYKPWRTEVTLGPTRRRQVVTVPALEKRPVVRAPEPPPVLTPPAPVMGTPPEPTRTEPAPVMQVTERRSAGTWSTARKVSVGLAVAGAGAVGAGAYFGLRSNDLESQSNEICPQMTCDDPEGLRLNDDAREAATRANIFYVAGGVALAVSAVTWALGAPDDETIVTPTVGDGRVGVSYSGRF